jgi:hypothetical protein
VRASQVSVYAATYWSMNRTGKPVCCPPSALTLAGVVLYATKLAASRWLLLALCMGFGVMSQLLTRRQFVYITVLVMSYWLASIVSEIQDLRDQGTVRVASLFATLQSILDILIIFTSQWPRWHCVCACVSCRAVAHVRSLR